MKKFFLKRLRQPGLEPGSLAWKANILTTRLLSLSNNYNILLYKL